MTTSADHAGERRGAGRPARPILELRDVTLRFGGILALDGLEFTVTAGHVCGLIGPNGAGKTSVFNVLSRIYRPQSGSVRFDGSDLLAVPAHRVAKLGLARTFQNLALFPTMSLLENVVVGAHCTGSVGFARAVGRVGVGAENRRTRRWAADLLDRLGLADQMHAKAAGLPFGTLKRLEVARALAARPRVLLLDEPAAGLTHQEVEELGDAILRIREDFGLTVLLVEHHMAMVMAISDEIVVMDFGRRIAAGAPADVQRNDRVVEAYLGLAD